MARDGMARDWAEHAHRLFKRHDLRQIAYVPDAGLTRLIEICHGDNDLAVTRLTTEEEGIALAAGAWLGGQRAAVMMQSSGVGNTANMIASTIAACRFPLFMLVTMRGEFGETNPWQMPMGAATPALLDGLGVRVLRADSAADSREAIDAGLRMAWESDARVAVLIGQRLIGAKSFVAAPARMARGIGR